MFSSNTTQTSGGYEIQRSLRFNAADTAYLNRTPSTTTNRRTFTWSGWVKRSEITSYQSIFSANDNTFAIGFWGDQQLIVFFDVGAYGVNAANLFRDPSAWYHIVVGIDTTQATAANRVKMYVNGTQITSFLSTPTYPPQNFDTAVNHTSGAHRIGAGPTYASNFFSGYQTEVYLIDGQQLTPSSFGETDTQTGVWKPKAYSGSYGTNGFYINFSDNSNTTAATLGKDYSGNGNNFTPNNFSVTAGRGNDSVVDVPTPYGLIDTGVGGTVRGNYATLNPLNAGNSAFLLNGNLDLVNASQSDWRTGVSTIAMSSGKWYAEVTVVNNSLLIGIDKASVNFTGTTTFIGGSPTGWGVLYTGQVYNNSGVVYNNTGYSNGDIIGMTFDADTGVLTWYKNNVAMSQTITGLTSGPYVFGFSGSASAGSGSINFGQRPFAYTAPSGYKALCTQNLPTPTIGATTATQANQYFTPVLYTGDGTNNRFISAGMTPDWTWIKERGRSGSHFEFDTLRGTGVYLSTNQNGGDNFAGSLSWTNSGPTSGGFKVDVGTNDGINYNTGSFVAWNWKANGSGVTNTSGTITSTVSANTTAGFSIVTYSGNNTNATVGHGLGAVPSMIIYKPRNQAEDWLVYHISIGASNILRLNTTAQSGGASAWQSTTPTSSVVYLGAGSTAQTGYNNILYCFAPVAGYSAFGSYTGNGSTDGVFIHTGFRPAFLLAKRTDTVDHWHIYDNKRNTSNLANITLYANLTNTDDVGSNGIDMLSNGFKMRNTFSSLNASGGTYIYMAFAENPFKYSLAR